MLLLFSFDKYADKNLKIEAFLNLTTCVQTFWITLKLLLTSQGGGGGGAVAQSAERTTLDEEVLGSISSVAAVSLLVESVSV